MYNGWVCVTPDGNLTRKAFLEQPSQVFFEFARNCVLAIHACLVHRSVVVALGGFDTSLQTCEDWDLWQRIARTGARFSSIPDALAYYRIRPGSASMNALQVFKDAVRVMTLGYSADPRVPNPAPEYASGLAEKSELTDSILTHLAWTAGLCINEDQDPLILFEAVPPHPYPGIDPDTVARLLFGALVPNSLSVEPWDEIWPRWDGDLVEAATLAGEPVCHANANQPPQQVLYAPELIAQVSQPTKPKPSQPLASPRNAAKIFGRDYFETLFANQADPWKYTEPYEEVKYQQTLELLPPTPIEHALELACAEGHSTAKLAPRVGHLTATDISQIAIEHAQERCQNCDNIRFLTIDLTKEELPGQFDLIVCSEVLYYLEDREALRYFARRIAEALRPGGYFLNAHANLVVDDPKSTGFNWDHPFGAKVINEKFARIRALRPVKEIRTPLYRIGLFQRPSDLERLGALEVIEMPQPTPPPNISARDILWEGGSLVRDDSDQVTTDHLPILMYHRVQPHRCDSDLDYCSVSPDAFEEQLRYLRDAGYYSIRLENWLQAKINNRPLPGRAITLTFDDGYVDFMTYAWPLLNQYGFGATMFLVTEQIGGFNVWDRSYEEQVPLMGWSDILKLQEEGVEFGSHSVSHPFLTALSPEEVVREAV
ncbi:MAG: SAM-dependent methyltransferase [Cyanophyceae cyanobacterium]